MPNRFHYSPLLRATVFLGLFWFAPSALRAQEPVPAAVDTLALPDSEEISGRGAFFRSLVLPGWGQAWVGAPVRGGIYFALESASLWMTYKTWNRLGDARERQEFLREIGELEEDDELGLVQSRENQLEDWITISAVLLFFSGADAYVAAKLADFDEHIGVRPASDGGLRLEASIPIGGRR